MQVGGVAQAGLRGSRSWAGGIQRASISAAQAGSRRSCSAIRAWEGGCSRASARAPTDRFFRDHPGYPAIFLDVQSATPELLAIADLRRRLAPG